MGEEEEEEDDGEILSNGRRWHKMSQESGWQKMTKDMIKKMAGDGRSWEKMGEDGRKLQKMGEDRILGRC